MIITIFRARLRDEHREAYMALAPVMAELASGMPGYRGHKVFVAEDGERVTIVEFEDAASQRAWATQVDHVAARRQGRAAFYAEYSLQVCELVRGTHFVAPPPGVSTEV